jgi:hypothetical protein
MCLMHAPCHALTDLRIPPPGHPLRAGKDACRKAQRAPAQPAARSERARQRTHKARAAGEEAGWVVAVQLHSLFEVRPSDTLHVGSLPDTVMDIKKAAKAGHMVSQTVIVMVYQQTHQGSVLVHPSCAQQGPCKVMAKDLVRTRRYISKFYAMRTQLQAVSLRLQTLRSNEQMAQAMKGATRVSPLPL